MDHPQISIALCTYNGEPFLEAQLASFLDQTRPPAELVVCDDGSTDGTLETLARFADRAHFPVSIHRNDARLGPAKNFERAIGLCRGDWIALADQDDVWLPGKLEALQQGFAESPGVEAIFSNGTVVDADLHPLGYTLWEHVGFVPAQRRMMAAGKGLEVLLKHLTVTGATLAIRSSLRRRVLPVPQGWMHDGWIALMAAATDQLRAVPMPLISYRQHGGNAVGAGRSSLAQRLGEALCIERSAYYRGDIDRFRAVRERLQAFAGELRPDALRLVEAKLKHLENRARLPGKRVLRIPGIMAELATLGYRRYSFSWQVAVKDFLLPEEKKSI